MRRFSFRFLTYFLLITCPRDWHQQRSDYSPYRCSTFLVLISLLLFYSFGSITLPIPPGLIHAWRVSFAQNWVGCSNDDSTSELQRESGENGAWHLFFGAHFVLADFPWSDTVLHWLHPLPELEEQVLNTDKESEEEEEGLCFYDINGQNLFLWIFVQLSNNKTWKKPNLRTIKKQRWFNLTSSSLKYSFVFQNVTVAAIPSNSWQSISLLIMVVVFVGQLHGDCWGTM